MNKEKYIRLIYLQYKGLLSSEEQKDLLEWLAASPDNQKVEEEIYQSLTLLEDYQPDFDVDVKADFQKVRHALNLSGDEVSAKVVPLSTVTNIRRKWLGIAAAIALLITASFFFWNQSTPPLQWANIETLAGETQSISLADGSKIWLNENTRFSYPTSFSGKRRPVELSGEAYFEIAADEDRPFIVSTQNSVVEVLGTSFNLRALDSEPTTTLTVKTGQVRFYEKNNKDRVVFLSQNQEAVLLHQSKQIALNKKADLNALSWQTNHLRFRNRSLTDVFDILERHFKIDIDCQNPALKDCRFSSSKEYNLESIFAKLKKLYHLEVQKMKDGLYVITGGGC